MQIADAASLGIARAVAEYNTMMYVLLYYVVSERRNADLNIVIGACISMNSQILRNIRILFYTNSHLYFSISILYCSICFVWVRIPV